MAWIVRGPLREGEACAFTSHIILLCRGLRKIKLVVVVVLLLALRTVTWQHRRWDIERSDIERSDMCFRGRREESKMAAR